ncbi:T9SS type A sorting domain-containing protein [bacterium]|nr:T9SS type A sorting domain-containing protein [bacterium]
MKKLCLFMVVSVFMTSAVFAASFSPTLLKLSAPAAVQYGFDGKTLEIPVTVSGTAAGVIFCVFTKEKGDQVKAVRNGYLGWHYVNKIDTCIYNSQLIPLDKGSNKITWNGKDSDGKTVPAGDYTYYLWAYDNVNAKTKVYTVWNLVPGRAGYFEEYGTDGKPLVNPFYIMWGSKWTIGNDPVDGSLEETTSLVLPEGYGEKERMQMHPTDHNYFYYEIGNDDTGYLGVWKFQWVPNGDAVHVTTWGTDGACVLPVSANGGNSNNWFSGVATDRNYLYVSHCNRTEAIVNFYYIDFDGSIAKEVDITDWWASPSDLEAGGQLTGGPNNIWVRDGLVYLNSHTSCLESVANPMKGLDESDDFWVWHNTDGDYVGDHNSEADAAKPWICFDFNVAPYTYTLASDNTQFSMTPAYDMGAVSFALYAPDGTGIGYLSYAGETAGIKRGDFFCDSGSAYDGIYTDNNSTGDENTKTGLWYIAHDSLKGSITNTPVAVGEETPASFAVAQNIPNPFNPSTTISFTIPQAGNVTVDIYNVAGQKIAAVADGFMSAGNHSVTWDASGFSAGVYFYTVKAGSVSKTMKMTLLK